MLRLLAAVLSVVLLNSVLLITSAAGGNCTIPPDAIDACPLKLSTGDCVASVEWFQQNEMYCKLIKHPAIMLKGKERLWVFSGVPFTVTFGKFKEYNISGGTCDYEHPLPNAPTNPFTDLFAVFSSPSHVLIANARKEDACYGIYFVLQDGTPGGTAVDPHIIVSGTGLVPPKVNKKKP